MGLVISLLMGLANPYVGHVVQGSSWGCGYYTSPVAHFLFFLLLLLVNPALSRMRPTWALRSGELVVVFVMMHLANVSPCMANYWVPMLIGPFYYASPENEWAQLIHPWFPDWVAPHDPRAILQFFEGSGTEAIPWGVWVGPLLAWLPLFVALHVSTLCLTVILRRQWMEHDRLIYPLVQVPLAMLEEDEHGRPGRVFFRSWPKWFGFALPVAVGTVQALHMHFPFVPGIELSTSISLFRNTLNVPIHFSFATLGFFFLLNREVSFGLWVFSLLNMVQRGIYGVLGVGIADEPALSVWSYTIPSLVHQSMGAMIALVLGSLWIGREHLRAVLRKAITGDPAIDDSDEVLSYRWAVLGLVASLGVMFAWLLLSGIPLLGALVFLFFAFVVFIAVSRVVAEGGVAVFYLPLVAPDAAVSAVGTSVFGAAGLVGLVFTRVWANDTFAGFLMPQGAQGLKLGEGVRRRRPWLFLAMLAAILASLAGGLWMLLRLSYTHGAINLSQSHFIWLAQYVYEYAAARISDPVGPSWEGWGHTGVGAIVMGLLMAARRFWAWWPLHPLGFPVSSVFSWMTVNALLAWLVKGVILKYGGPQLYRGVRPFFIGMILGQFVIYGVFWIVDGFTGMSGNALLR